MDDAQLEVGPGQHRALANGTLLLRGPASCVRACGPGASLHLHAVTLRLERAPGEPPLSHYTPRRTGVLAAGGGTVALDGCVVDGGPVHARLLTAAGAGSTLYARGCTFRGAHTTCAVSACAAATLELCSLFSFHTAGIVLCQEGTHARLVGCLFHSDTKEPTGVSVAAGASATAVGCSFSGRRMTNVFCMAGSKAELRGCVLGAAGHALGAAGAGSRAAASDCRLAADVSALHGGEVALEGCSAAALRGGVRASVHEGGRVRVEARATRRALGSWAQSSILLATIVGTAQWQRVLLPLADET